MNNEPSVIFMKYLLDKSHSKNPAIAKKEWNYCFAVKHLNGIQSTCVLKKRLNKYSIAFHNFRTNEIFHTNSKTQYWLHDKGKDRTKIIQTNPLGDGNGKEINNGMLNKVYNFVNNIYQKHHQNQVNLKDVQELYKYKYFLQNIKIEEQEQLNKILLKINYLIENFYNINYCESCCDFYLSKVKQSDYRPKCSNCYYKNDICFLKINNKLFL